MFLDEKIKIIMILILFYLFKDLVKFHNILQFFGDFGT